MKVLIIGGGGHARIVADLLLIMNDIEPLGFISRAKKRGIGPLGLSVLGDDSVLGEIEHDGVIVAIGDNRLRKNVFDRLVIAGETLISAVHPTAIIAPDVTLGKGCVVCAGAIVNTGTLVGDNVILNTGCTVDHECSISQHVHVAPGVNLAGNVSLGEGVFMGIGSTSVQGISIGEWTTIGAGAVVINDIPEDSVAVGVPAKVVD